jgi:hypothetical protein
MSERDIIYLAHMASALIQEKHAPAPEIPEDLHAGKIYGTIRHLGTWLAVEERAGIG